MKFFFSSDWNTALWGRVFEIIPALSIHFYLDYKFESIRISWLGFTIGIYDGLYPPKNT